LRENDRPATHPDFSHVRYWVFDLDNTLYPPSARLFDQIETRMTDYVMQALGVDAKTADHLRDHYWRTHGTTLAGLMREHDVDPGPYLDDVHDISLTHIKVDPGLRAAIARLPGKRIIYTNGPRMHADRVSRARGLAGIFHGIYGVEQAGFLPKPEAAAFQAIFAKSGVDPSQAAMFEDEPRNLVVPHDLGMACILVGPPMSAPAPHIHHQTEDLTGFLSQIAA